MPQKGVSRQDSIEPFGGIRDGKKQNGAGHQNTERKPSPKPCFIFRADLRLTSTEIEGKSRYKQDGGHEHPFPPEFCRIEKL
jgi:hypothetical protein